MENRRTETARENDDSAIIDAASGERAPTFIGSRGGDMQRDIASDVELERVADPEAREGANKQHDIDHQQRDYARHPADMQPGGDASSS